MCAIEVVDSVEYFVTMGESEGVSRCMEKF